MKKINWRYAFGEIIIVFIGISIAFSINRCSENSKNKDLKEQYLASIKNDVMADKEVLIENVKQIQQKIKLAEEVLPKLNTDVPDKMSATGKIFSLMELSSFYPNDKTYQALVNSGDFKLIDDFELKTTIEKHYSTYDIMERSYFRLENIQKEYVGDYFIHHMDYDAMGRGEFGFQDEKLLKNIILSIRGSLSLKLEETKKGIKSCEHLLKLLP